MLLLPLLLLVLFVLISLSIARRAALRRAEYEEELAREAASRGPRRGDDGEVGPSPFGGSPLGSLLEHMMSGATWGRSYTYDPVTGRWVDVSDRQPELPPEQPAQQQTSAAPRRRKTRQRTQPQSPLGSLFGG